MSKDACSNCGGGGRIPIEEVFDGGMNDGGASVSCARCHGSGKEPGVTEIKKRVRKEELLLKNAVDAVRRIRDRLTVLYEWRRSLEQAKLAAEKRSEA